MLNVTEINTLNDVKLRQNWNKILARSHDNNIYLTWEYLSTFWKHFGKGKKPRILCVLDGNEIIGIAPLRQSHISFAVPLGYNIIEPLGSRVLMPEGADYTGFILVKRKEESLKLLLDYLIKHDGWDFIHLSDIPETSIIAKFLTELPKNIPLKFKLEKGSPCYYLPIPSSNDILLKGLNRKFRKNLRRCMKKLETDYERVELRSYDEFDSVEEAMNIHFELNQKRWESRHMSGAFNTPEVRHFYIDMAKVFANKGWLALYFLTVNDKPISGLYGFEYNHKLLAAVTGFDPDYARYSVGNLLHAKVIERCIEKKLEEYDFLKGGEQYKSDWTQNYRSNFRIKFVNNTFTSNLYDLGISATKKLGINSHLEKSLTYH